MIITVGNIKGGVGKSTMACNIAALLSSTCSTPVTLIDGDKQGSSAEFTVQRETTLKNGAGYICSRAQGAEVRSQAKGFNERKGTVIVDAGGQDNPALRAALTVSDKILVPIPPKSFEAWSLDVMAELVAEVRETVNPSLQAFIFVNMGFPTGGDNSFIQKLIKEDYPEFKLIQHTICQRKVFSDAAGMGLSIMEKSPTDAKAIDEFLSVLLEAGVYQNNIISMQG